MKKVFLIFGVSLIMFLVGCGANNTNTTIDITEDEKIAILNTMTENIEGEWATEDGELLQITPEKKFLYEKNNGLVSLKYEILDPFNVEVTGVDGKPQTKDILFEEMEDKFKLVYNKKTYYKNK